MKASKFLVSCLLALAMMPCAFANAQDSARIAQLEQALQTETAAREALKNDVAKLNKAVSDLTRSQKRDSESIQSIKNTNRAQASQLDTLSSAMEVIDANVKTTAEQLGVEITDTNNLLGQKADSKDVRVRTIIGIVFFLMIAIICALVYYLLHLRITKGTADIEALRQKAEKLNEEIVGNFSTEMAEMQKISSNMAALKTVGNGSANGEPDHSLIKTLADRITFMEMTLSKMDPSIRGYKQLSRSIAQMKDNLLANGYELVDMLGKTYDSGMKVTANFIEDENLEPGQQIISGIIKPQINYKGVMIQAAQITVSQN